MLPTQFKSSKNLDFDKLIKAYIIKNYGIFNYIY
jgi:hypothetical protein